MSLDTTYYIKGGTPLKGSTRVGGAKNASFKIMIAALLADSPSTLLNFSHISDVALVADCINHLGASATTGGERSYLVDPSGLKSYQIPKQFGEASRASSMFLSPLLAKFGKAEVPLPGGDKIGARPLDRHLDGLKALGAKVKIENGVLKASAPNGLKGNTYRFEKNSHTGTETLILAASTAQGTTILENAAEETEVDDLITFMNEMGAKISRPEKRTIKIEGVKKLHGAIHKIMPDQNQAVSFACVAIASQGDIVVENCNPDHLTAFFDALDKVGGGYEKGDYGVRFFYKGPLQATDVTTNIHPGFKTDWQPLWVTMMTQAEGISTLHETVSQSRFGYADSLKKMGAKIDLFNPEVKNPDQVYNFNLDDVRPDDKHAARITGPTPLQGTQVTIKDLRHGATMLMAGIIAQGESIIRDPDNHIDRGYEFIEESFSLLGANIKKES